MMDSITILQVGRTDWQEEVLLPEQMTWFFLDSNNLNQSLEQLRAHEQFQILLAKPEAFTALLLTDNQLNDTVFKLTSLVESHAVFYPDHTMIRSSSLQKFLRQKLAQPMDMTNKQETIQTLSKILFSGQFGCKQLAFDLEISPYFMGEIDYQGHAQLNLEGNYGHTYRQLATFRRPFFYDASKILAIWPEFSKDKNCHIAFKVKLMDDSPAARIVQEWQFEEQDLKKPLQINTHQSGYLSLSIWASGSGRLTLGPVHYRWSRGDFGHLLLGDGRLVADDRSEVVYYFDPQNFKPPLLVYFSDWSTQEAFKMKEEIKALACPYLLISDLRLDGGAFFIGNHQLEEKIRHLLIQIRDFLNFSEDELILSGISMGAFAALYYAPDLRPAHLVLGKPLVNIGRLAQREKIERPNVFPSSLDLLLLTGQGLDEAAIRKMNHYLWDKFDGARLEHTQLFIAYMKNDDYDPTAFADLMKHARTKAIKLVGRGWIGRHDDDDGKVFLWLMSQFEALLRHFGREKE